MHFKIIFKNHIKAYFHMKPIFVPSYQDKICNELFGDNKIKVVENKI